jgi:trimeric autotransporter adhesin
VAPKPNPTRESLRPSALRRTIHAVTVAAVAFSGVALVGLAEPASAMVDLNGYTETFLPEGGCGQAYHVPAGVTRLQITAIGAPGEDGEDNTLNGADFIPVAGGQGGAGSGVDVLIRVIPGETLSVYPATSYLRGELGGGPGAYALDPEPGPGAGGRGGNATVVTRGEPHGCAPDLDDSRLVVVAAGGGGGGGAGYFEEKTGGAGGTESYEGGSGDGSPGGTNSSHDGAGGDGQDGGRGGHGYQLTGAPMLIRWCLPGSDGDDGSLYQAGAGGYGAQNPTPNANCGGTLRLNGGGWTTGGGGGGGAGYYGGGGGGGADESREGAAGGGGASGASLWRGERIGLADPVHAATLSPRVVVSPVLTPPVFTPAGNLDCVVGEYCRTTFRATGFPVPRLADEDDLGWPEGLSFQANPNGTATLDGFASMSAVGTYTYHELVAINEAGRTVADPVTVRVSFPPLASLKVSPDLSTLGRPLTAGGRSVSFSARGTYTTGLLRDLTSEATWATGDPSIASMTGSRLTPLRAGHTTLDVSYDGVTTTIPIEVGNGDVTALEVTPANLTIGLGATKQLHATATFEDGTTRDVTHEVTWDGGLGVATVDEDGLVTAVGHQHNETASVAADLGGLRGYSSVTVSLAHPETITLTPDSATMSAGSSRQLHAQGTYPGGRTADITDLVTWSSAHPALAAVSGDGLLRSSPNQPGGTTTISATQGGVTAAAEVIVHRGLPVSIAVTPAGRTLDLGGSVQLTATGSYDDGTTLDLTSDVEWTSDDPGQISLSDSGRATAVGSARGVPTAVRAALRDADERVAVQGYAHMFVTLDHPSSITVSPADLVIARGGSQPYTATGHYAGGRTADLSALVTWSIGDPDVAHFSSNRLYAHPGAAGQSTTVTAAGPDGVATATTTVRQKVGDADYITVTPASQTIDAGTSLQFHAEATYADGSTLDVTDQVAWTSSQPDVAAVDWNGLATATGHQHFASAFVSATLTRSNGSTTSHGTNLRVSLMHPRSILIGPGTPTVLPGQTQEFWAVGVYPDGGTADITNYVHWSTSTPQTSMPGKVLSTWLDGTAGETTVAATLGTASASTTVTLPGHLKITGLAVDSAPVATPYTSSTFTASGGSGHYAWTLSNAPDGVRLSETTGATVTITGEPVPGASGIQTMTLEAVDLNDYADHQSVPFRLTLTKWPQAIDVPDLPSTALSDTSLDLPEATGGDSGKAVTFSIDPATTSGACTLEGGRHLSFLGHGTCVIAANQAGDVTYAAAPTVSSTIKVLQAQTLHWESSAPQAVVLGDARFRAIARSNTSSYIGIPVVLSVDPTTTNDACSVDDNFYVYWRHAGECVVNADQAGGDGVAPAPRIQFTVVVQSRPGTLAFASNAPASARVGATYTPTFNATSPAPVTVAVNPAATSNDACSVHDGVVTFTHLGTCVVDGYQDAGGDYLVVAGAEQYISVTRTGPQTISMAPTPQTVAVGDRVAIDATGGGSTAPVELTVDPASSPRCSIDGQIVTFTAPGACTVRADQAGDADYDTAPTVSRTFTARRLHVVVDEITTEASEATKTSFRVLLVDDDDNPAAFVRDLDLDVTALDANGDPSTTGKIALHTGAHAVTRVSLPGRAAGIDLWYAETTAGAAGIRVSDPDGWLGQARQTVRVKPGAVAELSFAQQPCAVTAGVAVEPAVRVHAVDAYGNPAAGRGITLAADHGTIDSGALVTTDQDGIATFPDLILQAAGTYRLAAAAGSVTSAVSDQFTVTAARAPGAPRAVHAIPGDGRATVGWAAPDHDGGLPILTYEIYPYANGQRQTPTVVSNVTTADVTGLTNGTPYSFRVRALNAIGSAESDVSTAVTPQSAVVATRLTITSVPTQGTYGTPITVTGRLIRSDTGAGLASETVRLQYRTQGSTGPFTTFATPGHTDALGAVMWRTFKPPGSVEVRLTFAESDGFAGTTSAGKSVSLERTLSLSVSKASVRRGASVTFTGSVAPRPTRPVYLQRRSAGSWKTVTSVRSQSMGRFTIKATMTTKGRFRYRVMVKPDSAFRSSFSAERTVRVL